MTCRNILFCAVFWDTKQFLYLGRCIRLKRASQVALIVRNLPANVGDLRDAGLIPGLGRCPGGMHGKPLQYSCLENPMDRGAWWASVHGVSKSWTRLSTHTWTHLNVFHKTLNLTVQIVEDDTMMGC